MRGTTVAAINLMGLVGCATNSGDDAPASEPPTCMAVFLEGSNATSGTAELGPYQFGSGTFCLRLDATTNQLPHFAASTALRFPGTESPVVLSLTDPDGAVLVAGWDVVVGQTDPRVFANLELGLAPNSVRDVVLHVDPRGTTTSDTTTTAIQVALFERLE